LLTHPFISSSDLSSTGRDFADAILKVGGSDEGDDYGTGNDATS
jgi:hypothetical protein